MIVFVALFCAQPDFQSLRVRQLKEILQERGQKCDGCLEKQEYVDRCVETWSLPVVAPTKPAIKPQAKSTTLRAWTRRAERNVILPCMRNSNETFADTGETSALAARPHCWEEYWRFLEDEGLAMFDTPGLQKMAEGGINAEMAGINFDEMPPEIAEAFKSYQAAVVDHRLEMTGHLTTALAIVDALRLALGDEALEKRTAPVTVDMIGWAFHWEDQDWEIKSTHARPLAKWSEVKDKTRNYVGDTLGAVLRRLLPKVRALTIRGYGPEAPRVPSAAMRDDGWLSLELYPGLYKPTQPTPTATLIENSGLMDGFWPIEGGCLSEQGNALPATELERRRVAASSTGSYREHALPLSCLWRETIEALRDDGRMVYVTSYMSHEHLLTIDQLRSVGVSLLHAYPFGFRESNQQLAESTFDLLDPQKNTRGWQLLGSDMQRGHNMALWRYRVEVLGWEQTVAAQTRNCHVVVFQGGDANKASTLQKSTAEIQSEIRTQACEGARRMPTKLIAQNVMRFAGCPAQDEDKDENNSEL